MDSIARLHGIAKAAASPSAIFVIAAYVQRLTVGLPPLIRVRNSVPPTSCFKSPFEEAT